MWVSAGQAGVSDFGAAEELGQGFGADAGLFEAGEFGFDGGALGFEVAEVARRQKTDFVAEAAEAQVGVVLAQEQAVFGAGGEHAVRLGGAFGDEIVNEDADVGFVAAEDDGAFALDPTDGVDAGDESLARRLLRSRRCH